MQVCGPLVSGCIDHLLNLWRGVDRDHLDAWVALREHSKDLIREGLPYGLDRLEIKNHSPKAVYPHEQALRLRSRDQLVIAILGQPDWHHGFGKTVIVSA